MWDLVCLLVAVYVLIILYLKLSAGKCISKASLAGKTVLITGADKGIGYETVYDLAKRNARVIMACRDLENAERVAKEIQVVSGNSQIIAKKLDVSSLACVKKFVEDFLKEEKCLHILINNAGVPSQSSQLCRTSEGFELVFATNYLGHFLLTISLLDLLKKCRPGRIINVSSVCHRFVRKLDVSNLNSEKTFVIRELYNNSKLLQVLFSKELSRQLENTGITVNSLHPGCVNTNIFMKVVEPWKSLLSIMAQMFFKTPKEGAQTTIQLAVSEELEHVSGLYFSDCKPTSSSELAQDGDLAKKVFEASERYCASFLE